MINSNKMEERDMSSYVVYGRPIGKTCICDIQLIAEFESEKERNFQIFVSNKTFYKGPIEIRDERPYFMLIEDDPFPVFISKKQVDTFIKNHEKAKEFAYNVWMNRYR